MFSSLSQIELMVLITVSSVHDRTLDEDGAVCSSPPGLFRIFFVGWNYFLSNFAYLHS